MIMKMEKINTSNRLWYARKLLICILLVTIVVSFWPPWDHATCSSSTKQERHMCPLSEPPSGRPHSIQTPDDQVVRSKR